MVKEHKLSTLYEKADEIASNGDFSGRVADFIEQASLRFALLDNAERKISAEEMVSLMKPPVNMSNEVEEIFNKASEQAPSYWQERLNPKNLAKDFVKSI